MDGLRDRIHSMRLPLFEEAGAQSGSAGEFSSADETERGVSVIVLGPPGSGKGTQASLLSERLGLPHVSTGDMLRDRILVGDRFGREIAERIDVGRFVPDEWINHLIDDRLKLRDCRYGVILDGYPRTLSQAERFLEQAAVLRQTVVVGRLKASEEMLVERFAGRRQCSCCGSLFHLRYQPSLAGDQCDRPGCTGSLEQRTDDRPEYIARRLSDFEELTAPVIEFLESRVARFASVDAGSGRPEEVFEQILAHILPWTRAGGMADGTEAAL